MWKKPYPGRLDLKIFMKHLMMVGITRFLKGVYLVVTYIDSGFNLLMDRYVVMYNYYSISSVAWRFCCSERVYIF